MKDNTYTLFSLECPEHSLRLSVVGYQFPDASSDSHDSEWLLIRADVRVVERRWACVDPSEMAFALDGLAAVFEDVALGLRDGPVAEPFTDQTALFEIWADSDRFTLRVTLAFGLVDARALGADEVTLSFSLSASEVLEVAARIRGSREHYPPRKDQPNPPHANLAFEISRYCERVHELHARYAVGAIDASAARRELGRIDRVDRPILTGHSLESHYARFMWHGLGTDEEQPDRDGSLERCVQIERMVYERRLLFRGETKSEYSYRAMVEHALDSTPSAKRWYAELATYYQERFWLAVRRVGERVEG